VIRILKSKTATRLSFSQFFLKLSCNPIGKKEVFIINFHFSVPSFLATDKALLLKWLQCYQLQTFWPVLIANKVQRLQQLADISLKKESLEDLGIETYAAKKRFKLCVSRLQLELAKSSVKPTKDESGQRDTPSLISQSNSSSDDISTSQNEVTQSGQSETQTSTTRRVSEKTLAVGYWAKPQALKGATSDFLCIQAALRGSQQPDGTAFQLEFMVDSGSDVVTCRPEILEKLGAKLLGKIESRGIHATVEKELYQAYIQIGGALIPVEVMPESYESIGNQVMKHFKHYITGETHFWLQA